MAKRLGAKSQGGGETSWSKKSEAGTKMGGGGANRPGPKHLSPKSPGAKCPVPKCPGVKRPGPKCPGAKRPGLKCPGSKSQDAKRPG